MSATNRKKVAGISVGNCISFASYAKSPYLKKFIKTKISMTGYLNKS